MVCNQELGEAMFNGVIECHCPLETGVAGGAQPFGIPSD